MEVMKEDIRAILEESHKILKDSILAWENMYESTHDGPCGGPYSLCDTSCVNNANISEICRDIRALLVRIEKTKDKL